MKKLLSVLAIGAFVALLVVPQTASAGVKFGIKGGANIANVNGDFMEGLEDWKSTIGFCGGIFLELNFGRVLTIQPEVLYTMKGANTGDGKLKFDYIEIPVLLKLRIPISSVHPFVFAGPAFGFNLKATRSTTCRRPTTAPSSAAASSSAARSISTSATRWGSKNSRSPTSIPST
jgi:outer membrane immunogenic protein